ncbi:2-haloalkanoic acid dehalogenase [Streptomyces sparsogenes DSM 40356]|uniref:2-haloalkanoic acid dehalogenase n=1 Tax=Streptomyces sparsogenes DSM 40356 TaxID=1331668 RepID=A0A1R1SAS9_9ACTN|nr:2-haloalkanoic acid dehalogenase [Streptomyces sparsogenes DSM 40356]
MTQIGHIEVVVFDVFGTLVDESSGLRAGIRKAAPGADDAFVEELLTVWQRHRDLAQRRVAEGHRAYVNPDVIDGEAAQHVADRAGLTDPAATSRLAAVGWRLPPWADTVADLARLTRRFPVLGLSNAGRTALLRLAAHAGLRWHQALSAEDVLAYKPAPEVYRLAIDTAGCPPGTRAHGGRPRLGPPRGPGHGHADRLCPSAGRGSADGLRRLRLAVRRAGRPGHRSHRRVTGADSTLSAPSVCRRGGLPARRPPPAPSRVGRVVSGW